MGSVVSSCSHHGRLQVLEALKERRTLPVSNSLAEMAVPQPTKTLRVDVNAFCFKALEKELEDV